MSFPRARQALRHTDAPRPAPDRLLPAINCWTAQKDRAAATLPPSGITPSNIMSPARSQPGPWTEVRLGARAQDPSRQPCARTAGAHSSSTPTTPDHALDVRSLHK
jgi:hypothetical protein